MTFEQLLALSFGKYESFSVCADSRKITPGDIFVAVPGWRTDGHKYINQAIENGARYIVSEKQIKTDKAEIIKVDSTARALGILAHNIYANRSGEITSLSVTGTNGKTTVAWLVHSVITNAGANCGLIGTINNLIPGQEKQPSTLTTPDTVSMAKLCADMLKSGTEYLAIEASSHAIDQDRLAGINFTAAAFTNLTGDHLDYHKTMENYLVAKAKLFTGLSKGAYAVLNKDDKSWQKIAKQTEAKKILYSINEPAELTAKITSMDITGSKFTINYQNQSCEVHSPMLGKYNVSNHLAAAGLCIGAGFDLEKIAEGLSALKKVPGRLERVESNRDFTVLIDYAHTDDALKNVLQTLKPLCRAKLTVVFGCGGDRDSSKRPRMAKAAQSLADKIIITSDNPRSEAPEKIIADITGGVDRQNKSRTFVEPDRKQAIALAIENADKGDIILIAGKGHEEYQIIGTEKRHFSDSETARELLQ